MRLYLLLIGFCTVCFTNGIFSQTINQDIPLVRKFFHDKIQESQNFLMQADWKNDSLFAPTDYEPLNKKLHHAVTKTVDSIQSIIEANEQTESNDKIKYLRGLNECLQSYAIGFRTKELKPSIIIELLAAFKEALRLDSHGLSIEPVIIAHSYNVNNILLKSVSFSFNPGLYESNNINLVKLYQEYPEKSLVTISKNYDYPVVDSLIVAIARQHPDGLYTYAASYNAFSKKIKNNPDSLVQIISRMSTMKSGRQYFPFLDDIYTGRLTFTQIDSALRDSTKYFNLLVQTAISYADRMRQKDTPVSLESLNSKMAVKAKEIYINTINGLHDLPDHIRFRKLEKLSSQELYYLAVMGAEEIYTSSYVRGVYPRIWQKGKMERGDSLLLSVRFDHFKKWVKIAANYNTLDDFLKRMDIGNAELLMKAFVNGLDKSQSLEDAVDVADSYASISDTSLRTLILKQVQYNLSQAKNSSNHRATNIYNILNTLFLSMDSINNIDLTATLGIPPVYFMPNKLMQDSSGTIIIQQYFYGDKDGNTVFNSFLNHFRNANWRITMTDKWALVSSTNGRSVKIYSNRPLDEDKGLDAEAQADLNEYLDKNNLNPTMVIHRGHSYYLNSTIAQLAGSARIILLGSCGGYQNLSQVLQTCPSAHIISSKQTGSGTINQPMIDIILRELREDKDLNWPQLWLTFNKVFGNNDYFDDYVPPHKNLGAVFIMAYAKQLEREES